MKHGKYKDLSWENTSYSGIESYESSLDRSGDRLRYFKLSKGSVIPNHTHQGFEKIVIISGHVKFLDVELFEGDVLYTNKNEEHSAIALEDILMLVI